MRRRLAVVALLLSLPAGRARAQTVLEHTPNVQGTWTLAPGAPVFVFAHRFEVLSGGDELINIPTLTLAVGAPLRLTAGVNYTSNSEVNAAKLAGNELEYWLRTSLIDRAGVSGAATLAYNSASESVDAALSARTRAGPVGLVAEIRGFSNAFGGEDAQLGYTAGAVLHLTPYLAIQGDLGSSTAPSNAAVWSAGLAVEIPGTPHSFSLHAANAGATTLQGVSQRKVIGPKDVRYGFTFTVPLGSRRQWRRVFQGEGDEAGRLPRPAAARDTAAAEMRQVEFRPRVIRIRRGQSVIWTNRDPTVHTVDADDGSWMSGAVPEGGSFVRRFDEPGRYPYHCRPHPQMHGVVVVD